MTTIYEPKVSNLHFEDLFEIEKIQKLQDLFSKVNGVASIITSPDGGRITEPSNFRDICLSSCDFNSNSLCVFDGAKKNLVDSERILRCGKYNFQALTTEIIIEGNYVANWIIGQVRDSKFDLDKAVSIAARCGLEEAEAKQMLNSVPYMDADKFIDISNLFLLFVDEICEKARSNYHLQLEIAEKQNLISKLKSEGKNFQELLDKAPIGYQSLDSNGYFLEVNRQWLETLGYSRNEVVGKYFGDFVSLKYVDAFKSKFVKFKENGEIISSFKMIHKNGDEIEVEFHGKISTDIQGVFKQTHCVLEDVTRENNIRRALENEKLRYDLAMDATKDGLFDWNLITDEVYFSPGWKSMLGYAYNELPNVFSIWEELTKPEDVVRTWEFMTELIEKKIERYEVEFQMKHKEGHWVDVLSRASAMFNDEGEAIRVVGTHIDISANKKNLYLLKEKEEKANLILSASISSFWIASLDGYISEVNDQFCKISGFTREEVNGMHISDISIPDDYEEIIRKIAVIKEKGANHFDSVLRKKDGGLFEVEVSAKYNEIDNNIFVFLHDITEKNRAFQDLQGSLEREQGLADVVRNAPLGIAFVYPDGSLENCNLTFAELTGYTQNELKEVEWITMLTPLKWRNLEAKKLNQLTPSNRINYFEKEYIHKDGHIFPVSIFIKANYDENEVLINYVGFVTDISDRKKSENAIIESERKLYTLINNLQGIVYRCKNDEFFTMEYISDGINDVAAYTPSDLINSSKLTFLEMIHPEDREMVRESVDDRIKKDSPFIINYRIITSKSEIKHVLEKGVAIKDDKGEIVALEGFITDITDLKNIQNKLEEKQKYLETVMNAADDVAFVTTTANGEETEILSFSRGAEKIFGYQASEVLGKNVSVLHPENIMPNFGDMQEPLKQGLKGYDGETVLIRKSGETFPALLTIHPLNNSEGELIGTLGVSIDISKQKEVEQELIMAKNKAEENDKLKSAFLANMSHEIRTPMNGILGFAELLKSPKLSGEDQAKFIEIIEKSGERMLNIIEDLIDISKIESGQMEVKLSDTNVEEQLDFLYFFFKLEAKRRGLEFVLMKPIGIKNKIINSDKEKIYAILTNLIKNALKYTDCGLIEFGCKIKGQVLEFYVKDTGVGIPEDKQSSIFDRFIQADVKGRKTVEGTGLGLAISKHFVNMLGGEIWLESQENKGSSFYFTIPLLDSIPVAKVLESNSKEFEYSLLKDLKILIVEDDEISQFLIESSMKSYCREIISTDNGVDAVEICRENQDFDLVYMDLHIPELKGLEAIKEIRKFDKKVKIIVQTAYADITDRARSIQVGANNFITKPLSKDELLAISHSTLKDK